MPTNTTIDVEASKSVFVKTTGHGKLKTVILSVLADGRKLTPFVILESKNLPKGKVQAQLYRMSQNTYTENKSQITLLVIKIMN
jgi:hypothetical protein